MPTPEEIREAAEEVMAEIRQDRDSGRLGDVRSFSDLHGFVDANEYGGFTDPERRADWAPESLALVQDMVDEELRQRWVIVGGNPIDGLTFAGPYLDEHEAVREAESKEEGDWWVAPLVLP